MPLEDYRRRRDFGRTTEPAGDAAGVPGSAALSFVIQKHSARRLHYDLRLELDGVLLSWACPKGPSLDPKEKRLAVRVEDHPLEYARFEGAIPAGEYGAGTVLIWDEGTWMPTSEPHEALRAGKLAFRLNGKKLHGMWALIHMRGRDSAGKQNWLLIKERDEYVADRHATDILADRPESVASGQVLEEISPDESGRERGPKAEPGTARDVLGSSEPVTSSESTTAAPEPGAIPGARKASMPRGVEPQLATLTAGAPQGEGWLHEIKFDGYRVCCRVEGGSVRMLTRRGNDWTAKMGALAKGLGRLRASEALLDGEAVVMGLDGVTSFEALQRALSDGDDSSIVYFVFDMLYLDGYDLRDCALLERKKALESLLGSSELSGAVRYTDHVVGHGRAFARRACEFALEGVVSKRADAGYRPGRGRDWRKVKCLQRQEFVIGGFTEPAGSRAGFGSLLLGAHDVGGELVYAGRVGTGFDESTLERLGARLAAMERSQHPFVRRPPGPGHMHWVEPELVAEVRFSNWTRDGLLRQASFIGLREDKPATEVAREEAQPVPRLPVASTWSHKKRATGNSVRAARATDSGTPTQRAAESGTRMKRDADGRVAPRSATAIHSRRGIAVGGITITNPDRVVYPESSITKLDVVRYYSDVADAMLPHLSNRPLALVRCPDGLSGECFFQKQAASDYPDSIVRVPLDVDGEAVDYMSVDSREGLLYLVQLDTLEIHTWSARADAIERPDRIVIDLDPGESVTWSQAATGAQIVGRRFGELGLVSFVKTSGGKGYHIVAPLLRRHGWAEVEEFARALAADLTRRSPELFTSVQSKARRRGKIFLDYMRTHRGATTVAAYSTRARAGAHVSVPIGWEELRRGVRPDAFSVEDLPERLARLREDPWNDYNRLGQSITQDMWRHLGASRPSSSSWRPAGDG